MAKLKSIETSIATFYIEDGIVYMRSKKDADINLDATKLAIKARRTLQNNKPMPVLIDTSNVWQVSDEARAYSATKEVEELSIAMALLPGSSLATIMIANFFIKINKPSIPTKMFKNEGEAIEWLKKFKK